MIVEAWLLDLGGLKTVTWKFLSFYNFSCYQPCIVLQEAWLRATLVSKHWCQRPPIGSWAVLTMQHHPRYCQCISSVPFGESSKSSCKCLQDLSMKIHKFQKSPQTLQHKAQRQGTQHWERRQMKLHTRPQNHKQIQFKFTRQPFPESSKLFDNCFQKHPQVSKFSSTYMDNNSKTVDNTQNNNKTITCYDPQLLGYLMWQVVISIPWQLHHWIIRVP